MGNGQSGPARPKVGYQVLKVTPGGPGDSAGLRPFFDFIIAANGHVLESEGRLLDVLRTNLEHEVSLSVYNTTTDRVRESKITPSLNWGGHGIIGISTRFCSLVAASEHVWHILDVHPNSPAAEAGLQAYLDYVVGTPDLVFNDPDDFFTLIQNNIGATVQLYVYNLRDDDLRLVSLKPRKDWGGVGSLGCEAAFGLLHQIPRDRAAALAQHGIQIDAEKAVSSTTTAAPVATKPPKDPASTTTSTVEFVPKAESSASESIVTLAVPMISNDRIAAPTTTTSVPSILSADSYISEPSTSYPSAYSTNFITAPGLFPAPATPSLPIAPSTPVTVSSTASSASSQPPTTFTPSFTTAPPVFPYYTPSPYTPTSVSPGTSVPSSFASAPASPALSVPMYSSPHLHLNASLPSFTSPYRPTSASSSSTPPSSGGGPIFPSTLPPAPFYSRGSQSPSQS